MSYPGYFLGKSYFFAALQLMYSTAPANSALPLWVRVNLGAMAMKGYSILPKASDCLISYPGHSLERSYSSAELQLMYSTAPANSALPLWVRVNLGAMAMKGSDGLMSYPGHSLGKSYSFAEMQSVYSTTQMDW